MHQMAIHQGQGARPLPRGCAYHVMVCAGHMFTQHLMANTQTTQLHASSTVPAILSCSHINLNKPDDLTCNIHSSSKETQLLKV